MSNNDTIKKTLQVEDKFTKPMTDFKDGLKSIAKESDKADDKVDGFNDSAKETGKATKSASVSLKAMATATGATVVAVAGAIAVVTRFVNKTAEMADEVGKASQRMDVSVEFYQRMTSASEHAGTSITTVETAMRTMLRTMQQVNEGNKLMTDTYENLGIEIYDTNGAMRNQEVLFRETMITLSEMENHTERNAMAQKLLGRSASQLAPLFNEGADAVRNYMNANDSAVVVSKEMTVQSARYNDSLLTIKETLLQAKNKGLEPFMESMADLNVWFLDSGAIDYFTDYLTDVGNVASWVAEQINKVAHSKTEIGKADADVVKQMEINAYWEGRLATSRSRNNEEGIAHAETMLLIGRQDEQTLRNRLALLREESKVEPPKRTGGTTPASTGGGVGGDEAARIANQKLEDAKTLLQFNLASDKAAAESLVERLNRERAFQIEMAILDGEALERDRANAEASHEIWVANQDRRKEEERAILEERWEMVGKSLAFASEISSAMSTIHSSRMDELRREYDYEEERIKNSTMSRRKKEKALEELAEKRKKTDIESAKRQVVFAGIQGAINVAMAIQNANLAVLGAMAQGQGGAFARIAGGLAVAGATVGAVASVVSSSQSIPKREFGGVMRRNELYEVAERNKDEVFSSGGKSFMMPSQGGRATPDVKSGGSTVVNMNVTFGAGADTQTIEQRLPSMIAKGLEMADRQGEVRYERMNGFQKAIGN